MVFQEGGGLSGRPSAVPWSEICHGQSLPCPRNDPEGVRQHVDRPHPKKGPWDGGGLEVLELTKFQATKEKELEGRDASFLQCQVNGEGRRRW